VVIAIVLRRLANHGADAGSRRTADDGALQAAAKDSSQHRTAASADQRSFTRPDPTRPMIVMVVVVAVTAIVVIIAVATTIALAVVVGIVAMLCERRSYTHRKQKRHNLNCISKSAHLHLDARSSWEEIFNRFLSLENHKLHVLRELYASFATKAACAVPKSRGFSDFVEASAQFRRLTVTFAIGRLRGA
jgi:hypothetical protein